MAVDGDPDRQDEYRGKQHSGRINMRLVCYRVSRKFTITHMCDAVQVMLQQLDSGLEGIPQLVEKGNTISRFRHTLNLNAPGGNRTEVAKHLASRMLMNLVALQVAMSRGVDHTGTLTTEHFN